MAQPYELEQYIIPPHTGNSQDECAGSGGHYVRSRGGQEHRADDRLTYRRQRVCPECWASFGDLAYIRQGNAMQRHCPEHPTVILMHRGQGADWTHCWQCPEGHWYGSLMLDGDLVGDPYM